MNLFAEKIWHRFFEAGVALKGFNGIFETILGSFLLFASKSSVDQVFLKLTRAELLEKPNDRLFTFLSQFIQNLSPNTQVFAAIYILAHGILNIFLAVQLYREKIWAYPVTLCFMIMFIIYQIHRITIGHSLGLTVITIFDAFFVTILWHEYRRKKVYTEAVN